MRLPATAPSHDSAAGCKSPTVTSAAPGRSRASSCSATLTSPAARAVRQSRCRRSGEVIASSPASGMSSANSRWAVSASGATALDERVVEGADRKESCAEERTAETERGELQKEIALGDAELDVLTLRRHRPALRRDDLFLAKRVGAFGAVEDPAAVDPRPEVG